MITVSNFSKLIGIFILNSYGVSSGNIYFPRKPFHSGSQQFFSTELIKVDTKDSIFPFLLFLFLKSFLFRKLGFLLIFLVKSTWLFFK